GEDGGVFGKSLTKFSDQRPVALIRFRILAPRLSLLGNRQVDLAADSDWSDAHDLVRSVPEPPGERRRPLELGRELHILGFPLYLLRDAEAEVGAAVG